MSRAIDSGVAPILRPYTRRVLVVRPKSPVRPELRRKPPLTSVVSTDEKGKEA